MKKLKTSSGVAAPGEIDLESIDAVSACKDNTSHEDIPKPSTSQIPT